MSKIRILTDGDKYRLQKKWFCFWRNINMDGKYEHPEQGVHYGRDTVNTMEEAILAKDKILKPKHKPNEWVKCK